MSRTFFLALVVILFLFAGILYSCSQTEETGENHHSGSKFVGEETCQSCHAGQVESWKGSHHDYAMKRADSASVRGDFRDVIVTHRDENYRFFMKDSLYMVETAGPEGNKKQYRVTHTFGWEPLQQYLLDFGSGKLQALNIAWDTEKEQWFALNPDEDIRHGDWLHWTGGAMNWNTMCADCHSTNLKQNYIAEADSFHTSWSSINVSCESCHGPGSDHVDFMQSEQAADATIERIRSDLNLTANASQIEQINQCAQCHSLREDLTDDYEHEGEFLDHFNPSLPHPASYFPDGQIREEVYVYGSFLQSKMFREGVECADCHDPHSLQLKANVQDNSLCMSCHEPRYNTTEHHFHKPNTEASRCINCHMPGRYYMEVDFRRDHSFRVPRPDLSEKFNTPNACNDCHNQQPAEWAARAVEEWYGPDRPEHFSATLAMADSVGPEALPELQRLVADTVNPGIARATAVWYMGQFPERMDRDFMEKSLRDEDPLVRISAARALASMPAEYKQELLTDLLDDSVRAVRISAAAGLAEFSVGEIVPGMKQHFNKALDEYRHSLEVSRYFPRGLMNLGRFYEEQDRRTQAIEAYEQALEKDPHFNPARVNLAYLYNAGGENARAEQLLLAVIEQEPGYGPAHYSLGLLLAEDNRLEEAIQYFEQAAVLMPDADRVRYNWAIVLQTLDRPEEAEKVYLQAIELAPEQADYRYGICTLYLQQEMYREALPHARELLELSPGNQQARRLLQLIESEIN